MEDWNTRTLEHFLPFASKRGNRRTGERVNDFLQNHCFFATLFVTSHSHKIEAMFAIVEIAGQQFKVEKDQEVFVHRLEGKEGSKISLDKVLLLDNNGKVEVGTPTLKTKISAQIVEHLKGDKTIVFKKKRRKGYKVKNGHRQFLTKIKIEKIG